MTVVLVSDKHCVVLMSGGSSAGGPAELPVEDGVGLGDAGAGLGLGHLRAKWVAGDDAFGMSPSFR